MWLFIGESYCEHGQSGKLSSLLQKAAVRKHQKSREERQMECAADMSEPLMTSMWFAAQSCHTKRWILPATVWLICFPLSVPFLAFTPRLLATFSSPCHIKMMFLAKKKKKMSYTPTQPHMRLLFTRENEVVWWKPASSEKIGCRQAPTSFPSPGLITVSPSHLPLKRLHGWADRNLSTQWEERGSRLSQIHFSLALWCTKVFLLSFFFHLNANYLRGVVWTPPTWLFREHLSYLHRLVYWMKKLEYRVDFVLTSTLQGCALPWSLLLWYLCVLCSHAGLIFPPHLQYMGTFRVML